MGGSPLLSAVLRVDTAEGALALAKLLHGDSRNRPVVLVTVPASRAEPPIDAEEIAREAGELADVYVVPTSDVSRHFSERVPGTHVGLRANGLVRTLTSDPDEGPSVGGPEQRVYKCCAEAVPLVWVEEVREGIGCDGLPAGKARYLEDVDRMRGAPDFRESPVEEGEVRAIYHPVHGVSG